MAFRASSNRSEHVALLPESADLAEREHQQDLRSYKHGSNVSPGRRPLPLASRFDEEELTERPNAAGYHLQSQLPPRQTWRQVPPRFLQPIHCFAEPWLRAE